MATRTPQTIGLLGMGQMGAAVARLLSDAGWRVVTACDGRSDRTREAARAAGAEDVGTLDTLVHEAPAVLSIMGSADAVEVAEALARAVSAKDSRLRVYAECNLIAPADMRAIGARFAKAGVATLDIGIVGPPPGGGVNPVLYVAGPEDDLIDALASSGLEMRHIGSELGRASALKVYSAAVWQGCVALVAEVVEAAENEGLGAMLVSDLASRQPQIFEWFEEALPHAQPRAARWTPDMQVVSRTMEHAGRSGAYHAAAGEYYALMAERFVQCAGTDPVRALLQAHQKMKEDQ